IPPAPRGIPKIEVTFDIDANGILSVSAKDMASGKEQKIRIEASSGLSEKEIEKMVQEAKENAAEDRKRRELIDTKNEADSLVYQTEKNLTEYGEKLSEDDKGRLQGAVDRVKAAVKSENLNEIKSATEGLNQVWSQLSANLYQQGGAPGGGPENANGAESSANENVEEADFEVVDDDNKDK
ncbi:MAG: Hsp70 family protein, partial [Calditrichaeota bacterium]|nr:Hsp70 family protein [Calditrichota bacterium]